MYENKVMSVSLQKSVFEQAIHAVAELSEALSFSIFDAAPLDDKARNAFFSTDYAIVSGSIRCIYVLSDIVSAALVNSEIEITPGK